MNSNSIENLIKSNSKRISKTNILCIGDLILDQYIYGNVERMSPEAPVPILSVNDENFQLGGVGNVARNISSLGGKATIISLIGKDSSSKYIKKLITKEKNLKGDFVADEHYSTPLKTRFLNNFTQLLRADKEGIISKLQTSYIQKIKDKVRKQIKHYDAVIISDYNKGLITKELIKELVKLAKKSKRTILADPKSKDFKTYEGVDFLTPNQKELSEATNNFIDSEKEAVESGKQIIEQCKIKNILVTRSEKGMILINNKKFKIFPTLAKEIYDVSGAGDTVIAVLTIMLASGFDIETSAFLSNHAAGIVVGKRGTAVTTQEEMIKF
tara:strand:+ start:270 stop:1250 length:981 start_codon:yes stop_codon:yes gene_type:complete